jgi:hypothetical protein
MRRKKMKASESVQNYPSKLREYSNYAVRGVKKICKAYGPREPGSQAEFDAQKAMLQELESCCEEIKTEEFPVHPRAFMGWVPDCAISLIIASVLNFFGYYIIALALVVFSLLFAVTEFLLYKPYFDIFYRKKTSHNVIAVRKPSGEVRRRIILSGHSDSAYEWNYTYLGGPILVSLVIILNFFCFIIAFICTIGGISAGHLMTKYTGSGFLNVASYVFLAWIPILFSGMFFSNYKRVVMGANDDLTGCYTAMAVVKYLGDNNIRFENTEVRVILTGSEEAGLRGAKAYAKAHKQELEEVETAYIGFDTMRDFDYIAIYNRDMTGLVKNDPKVCDLLKEAGKNAGFDLPLKSVYLGASDAAAISQAGFHAATLAAMDPSPARYYHTRLDTEDNLDPKTVEACINIALETTFLFDEKGLS